MVTAAAATHKVKNPINNSTICFSIDFNFSAEERQVSLSQVAWHSICPVVPGSTDLVFGMTSTGKDNIGVIARNEQLKSEMHPLPSSKYGMLLAFLELGLSCKEVNYSFA